MQRLLRDDYLRQLRRSEEPEPDELDEPAPLAPGRRTLTERLARGAGAPPAPGASALVAEALAEPGTALPAGLRRQLERAVGSDLGGVRVRTGAAADRAAVALGARAFAIGRDVVFAAGRYRPDDDDGRRLIAHEVAHTVQHGGAAAAPGDRLEVSRPGDAGEVEADRFAEAFAAGGARAARAARPAPASASAARIQGEWQRGQQLPAQETEVPEHARDRQEIEELQEEGPPIRMYRFEGRGEGEPVLIVGGMHGDERGGIEVVDILLDRLQALTTRPPQDIYVIPILHPDNAAAGRRGRRRTPVEQPSGRGTRPARVDPNRDFPDEGRSRQRGDQPGPRLEGTRALLRAIEQVRPARVIQLHGTPGPTPGFSRDRQRVPTAAADGIRARADSPDDADRQIADLEARAARGTDEDAARCRQMAQAMRERGHGRAVAGNAGDRVDWAPGTPGGTSLGEWGSAAVADEHGERPAMSVITVETRGNDASVDRTGRDAERRRAEMMALADVIEEFLLGTRPRQAPAPRPEAPPRARPAPAPAPAGDRAVQQKARPSSWGSAALVDEATARALGLVRFEASS